MIITVDLKGQSPARITDTVILPEEEVILSFTSAIYSLGELLISVKKDNVVKKYKTKDKLVDISEFCTSAGCVDIEVSLMVGSDAVKDWRVEPLLIKEINHSFAPIPEIEQMREELATMKSAIKELRTIVENNEM